MISYQPNRHAAELLLGDPSQPMLAAQVKMRARLRALLGKEKDLADSVRRSTFCWWLHENHEHLSAGEMPPWKEEPDDGDDHESATGKPPDETLPTLVLWPFAKQFMGNFGIRNFGAAYRAVVQAALPGLSQVIS